MLRHNTRDKVGSKRRERRRERRGIIKEEMRRGELGEEKEKENT